MTGRSVSSIGIAQLPAVLPIFPLTGVLLLPRGRLPLNIFEPRYLAMFDDALKGDRLIGMIQPSGESPKDGPQPIFSTGCAGRIVAFEETDDGRYLVNLGGVCRFSVVRETEPCCGYRRVEVDWSRFAADLQGENFVAFDKPRLTTLLRGYFRRQDISADWDAIENAPPERLVTCLAMICPFSPGEKQALIEAPSLTDRAAIMIKILEMALAETQGPDTARH